MHRYTTGLPHVIRNALLCAACKRTLLLTYHPPCCCLLWFCLSQGALPRPHRPASGVGAGASSAGCCQASGLGYSYLILIMHAIMQAVS